MLPKIDLTTFFLSISQAAMQALQPEKYDFEMARHNIDLLELLQQKTQGNLSADETQLLNHLLFQLRMGYVQAEKKT
jgi:hypothetical protein